jgi:hypothetical protein
VWFSFDLIFWVWVCGLLVKLVQDDGKPDANGDDSRANQREIYCALIDGKGKNVVDGLHDVFCLFSRAKGKETLTSFCWCSLWMRNPQASTCRFDESGRFATPAFHPLAALKFDLTSQNGRLN